MHFTLLLFQESYTHVNCPAQSRRTLYFAWVFLIKSLRHDSTSHDQSFARVDGADVVEKHYTRLLDSIKTLGGSLKAAAESEIVSKDEMEGQQKLDRINK